MGASMQMHPVCNALHLHLHLQLLSIKIKTYRRENRGGIPALLKSLEMLSRQHLPLWRTRMEWKRIEFRQLCAIVRAVIQRDPKVDDAEWKAKTLELLARMGFDEPADPDMLSRAMTQVEFAVRKTLGPRMAPLQGAPEPKPKRPEIQFEGRTHRPAGWDLVQKLMADLTGSKGSARTSAPPPRETYALTEEAVVDEFWRLTREDGADRVALLRAFAEIAILRPADWDPEQIRSDAQKHRLYSESCFGCRSTSTLHWHHIIQVQHGGSNYLRNRVAICAACHADIHPWLAPGLEGRRLGGWSHLSECFDVRNLPQAKKESA